MSRDNVCFCVAVEKDDYKEGCVRFLPTLADFINDIVAIDVARNYQRMTAEVYIAFDNPFDRDNALDVFRDVFDTAYATTAVIESYKRWR